MNKDAAKTITDILTAWIGAFAIAGGGIFAIVQYLDKVNGDKASATLTFLDRLNRSPLAESFRLIAQTWHQYENDEQTILNDPQFEPKHEEFILRTIDRHQLAHDVDLLTGFYASLAVCVQRRICDTELASNLFVHDANTFYRKHYVQIQREQRAHGDRIQQFVLSSPAPN